MSRDIGCSTPGPAHSQGGLCTGQCSVHSTLSYSHYHHYGDVTTLWLDSGHIVSLSGNACLSLFSQSPSLWVLGLNSLGIRYS